MKIHFKQWLDPQMGIMPVDPKTPLVLEVEIERQWVGLTDEDLSVCDEDGLLLARYWEAILRDKNV